MSFESDRDLDKPRNVWCETCCTLSVEDFPFGYCEYSFPRCPECGSGDIEISLEKK